MIARFARPRLALVGAYPPPLGGCSVHVQRLNRSLDDSWTITVIDLYGRDAATERNVVRCGRRAPFNLLRAITALRAARPSVTHFHVSALRAFALAGWPLLLALPSASRSVLTIHGGAFAGEIERAAPWRRRITGALLRRFDAIIAVSEPQRQALLKLGVRPARITVVPAFVPPIAHIAEESAAVRELSGRTGAVVVCSGYAERHYGFHHVIAALELLRRRGRSVGLVLCWYNSYDKEYVASLDEELRTLPHLVFRDLPPDRFAAVLAAGTCYVRATDRDGDAVAIREASYFDRPVVASDAAPRPPGCLVYPYGDVTALAEAIETVLNDPAAGRVPAGEDGIAAIRGVYEQVSR